MSFCTFPVRCFGLYTDGCRCREIAGGIHKCWLGELQLPFLWVSKRSTMLRRFLRDAEGSHKRLKLPIFLDLLWLPSVHAWFCDHFPIMFLSCVTTVHFPGSTVVPRRQLMLRRVWAELPQLLPIEGDMPLAARCVGAVGGFAWVNRQKWGIHHQKWMWHII